jgi:hypothetical protein
MLKLIIPCTYIVPQQDRDWMYTTTQHADTAMSLQSLVNVIDVLYVAGITFAQHAFISKYTWNTALNLNRGVSVDGDQPCVVGVSSYHLLFCQIFKAES